MSCSLKAGLSILTFSKTDKGDSPFYHFAFNIPENKIEDAEYWQQSKTDFIKPPKHLTDDSLNSDNIVHFRHWDAHSVFFYDPAGNVVEYIARHTLKNTTSGKFTVKDILCISEIGLVVDDVFKTSNNLLEVVNIPQYKNSSENFLAHGDHHGLILLFKQGTLEAFNKGKHRQTFETEILINPPVNQKQSKLPDHPFIIRN